MAMDKRFRRHLFGKEYERIQDEVDFLIEFGRAARFVHKFKYEPFAKRHDKTMLSANYKRAKNALEKCKAEIGKRIADSMAMDDGIAFNRLAEANALVRKKAAWMLTYAGKRPPFRIVIDARNLPYKFNTIEWNPEIQKEGLKPRNFLNGDQVLALSCFDVTGKQIAKYDIADLVSILWDNSLDTIPWQWRRTRDAANRIGIEWESRQK